MLSKVAALVVYDPDTGMFTTRSGRSLGSAHGNGYIRIAVGGMRVYAQRLAWFICYGDEPQHIDHINHDKADNRIRNLRAATASQNVSNRGKLNANNTSGYRGVTLFRRTGKWSSTIKVQRRSIHLGYFDDINDAVKARRDAEMKFMGEFAPANERTVP